MNASQSSLARPRCSRRGRCPRLTAAITLALAISALVPDVCSGTDLFDLSLEEILNIPVHSVSKTEKPLLDQAVSATVVTRSQIRERGYRDVLDVLRDLPGIYIVDLTSSEHAASEVLIRGVEAKSKMLYLLDGEKISSSTGSRSHSSETFR